MTLMPQTRTLPTAPKSTSEPVSAHPRWMNEMTEGEQLFVWSFRHWASGRERWPLVWNAYAGRFGAIGGRRAMTAFARLFDGLCQSGRRTIGYHQPCCPCLGRDEVMLTTLVAARPGLPLATAFARSFVGDRDAIDIVGRAATLGTVFKDLGAGLPLREGWLLTLDCEAEIAGSPGFH